MYSFGWMTLVIISLAASLVAFIWGLCSGQFAEQARARYLPLRDMSPTAESRNPRKKAPEYYVLLGIIICCLLVFTSPILLSLWTPN
jgi:nitrogen fixation-related uncharacterized protein